jgi:catechol 2,3-dioxygenase-like lactoylglutathione lyase family enzyme
LFITEQPGLELALDAEAGVKAPSGQHFGLVVETTAAVEEQIARLTGAGYAIDVEREEVCCYANQTKVWTRDPDGRRWETYVVHADTEDRDDAPSACCA